VEESTKRIGCICKEMRINSIDKKENLENVTFDAIISIFYSFIINFNQLKYAIYKDSNLDYKRACLTLNIICIKRHKIHITH